MPTPIVATATARRIPGILGQRFDRRITTKVPAPMEKAVQFASPLIRASAILHKSCSGPVLSIETWSSLGSWLMITVSAMPFI